MKEIKRILDRFDGLMEDKSFDEAERLLTYWINECEADDDKRNRFTLLNELVGFYRMTAENISGMNACEKLLKAVESMELGEKVSGATAFINAATAYKSFGYADRAILLYEKAKVVYERDLEQSDDRLPALYNNMALALMDLKTGSGNLEKALGYFEKALGLLQAKKQSENEQAITYLNLADLAYIKLGAEASESLIEEYVQKAYELLLKSYEERHPDFRMTAEKCIPVIRHYGYFAMANILQEKIEENKK